MRSIVLYLPFRSRLVLCDRVCKLWRGWLRDENVIFSDINISLGKYGSDRSWLDAEKVGGGWVDALVLAGSWGWMVIEPNLGLLIVSHQQVVMLFERAPPGSIQKLTMAAHEKSDLHKRHLTRIFKMYDKFSNLRKLDISGDRFADGE